MTKQMRNQRRKKQQTHHRSINTSNLIDPQNSVVATIQDYDHGQLSLSVLKCTIYKEQRNTDYGLHHQEQNGSMHSNRNVVIRWGGNLN